MSIIPIDRKMKIQAKTPEMKIEFFTDDEIERMKILFRTNLKTRISVLKSTDDILLY